MNPIKKITSWYFSKRALPIWAILIIDSLIVIFSGILCYALDHGMANTVGVVVPLFKTLCLYLPFCYVGFKVMRTYRGVMRYSSFVDLWRIGVAMFVAMVLALVANQFIGDNSIFMPLRNSDLIATFFVSAFLMCAIRVFVKILYDQLTFINESTKRTFIYGVKHGGIGLAKNIKNTEPKSYILRGFVCNDDDMAGKLLMGVNVYKDDERLIGVMKRNRIKVLLVSPLMQNEFIQKKSLIDDLISKDVPQNRIAIIVRSNINAQLIAEYFSQNAGYIKIVSEDAFKIESSVAVNIIINAMRLLVNPDNDIAKAYLVKAYRNKIQHKEIIDDAYAGTHMSDEESLPADFVDQRTHLLTKSLYDIVEHIFISFRLHELNEESAYICTFYDLLRNFIKDNTPDLDAFIEEWENSIHDKTIQANEIDGVRLITIHKSKGLEFDNVIIPFCDWKVNDSGTIWCYPQEAPFNTLPVIPIDYSPKQMKGTIYENDYLNEYLQNTVDNLNLLYVAFTRASDNLFVIGKRNSPQLRSFIIEKSLAAVAEHLPDSSYECDDDSSSPITFHYGNTCIPKRNDVRKSSRNVFMQPVLQTETDIDTYICKAEFRQSNKSRDFIEGDDDDSRKRYIRLGSVLHKLFSTINTADDIDNALLRMEYEGVTYDCGMTVDEIRKLLTQRLSSTQVAKWFSGRWKLFNECTILSYDEEKQATVSHRPDRVMTDGKQMIIVDFKFGNPKPEYNRQVREYIALVSQMGYKNVKGYLWFVYSNKIVEVK